MRGEEKQENKAAAAIKLNDKEKKSIEIGSLFSFKTVFYNYSCNGFL